ncbi:M20/M25/M40 family metallo-hydrolase [Streptomyces sp. NPDC004250]|uniref:M20/M25/M40 family metallo-hydrolase n=1 Tax=Streptomyces sp. NPDC004250 TaxID=3364692 RepID=UPI0036C466E3
MRLFSRLACVAVAFGLSTMAGAVPVTAADRTTLQVPEVTQQDVMPHLEAFQEIADRNGGTREHGTKGYQESVAYVKLALDQAGFVTRLQTFDFQGAKGYNLIADWPGGDPNHVVFEGAHLDSIFGPGINDNGSGSAAVLATALKVAQHDMTTDRHLRFAWWGAEEQGLIGSKHYVDHLSATDRKKIDVYLNLDQAGSKNVKDWLVIHDAPRAADAFEAYFAARQLPTFEIGIGGSDHVSFGDAGIPTGGFSTGISDCIHEACDDINNIDPATEVISTIAMLNVTWKLAATQGR